MAGGGAARGQGQPGAGLAHAVGEGEGVAVDGGIVEGRHVARADQRSRPGSGRRRRASGTRLDARDRGDPAAQQRMSRANADPLAAIGEAVLGKPGHGGAAIVETLRG